MCSDNMVAELESFTGLIQRVKGYVRIRHSHTLNSLAFLRSLRYIDGENLLDEYDPTHTHTQLNIWMMVRVSLLSLCSFFSSVFVEVQGPPELCLWPICDNLFFIFSYVFKSCCINEDGAVCFVCEGATCVGLTECFGLITAVSSLKKKKGTFLANPIADVPLL